jgi:hypothetical protein
MDVASTVTRFAASLLGCNVTGLYLGEILTPQAVRLFIRAPLPLALWVATLDHYQIFGSGSVSNVLLVFVDNRFTEHNAVIVVPRMAVLISFQFQVQMLTLWWINSLFPLHS